MKKDLLEYFFHKSFDKFIGFEVSDRSVKAVYLIQEDKKITLQNAIILKIKPNLIIENQIKEASQLVDIFNDIREEFNISEKEFPIGISFPGQSTVSKLLKINKNLLGSEQEEYIQQEITKQLHQQNIDISMDYHVFNGDYNFDGSPKEDETFMDVISVSALQKDIDQRVEIAKAANFEPKIIDVDYLALAGAASFLLPENYGEITAIFYLGHGSLSLIVMNHYNVIYSKETTLDTELWKYLSYDIDKLNKKDDLKLKEKVEDQNIKENNKQINIEVNKEMSNLEHNTSKDNDLILQDNYSDVLVSGNIIKQFSEQCHSLLQFFYSSQKGMEIKNIVLSGCFNLDKSEMILEVINERFSIPGTFLEFNEKIKLSNEATENSILKKASADLMVSFGTALRGFDDD